MAILQVSPGLRHPDGEGGAPRVEPGSSSVPGVACTVLDARHADFPQARLLSADSRSRAAPAIDPSGMIRTEALHMTPIH